MTNGQNHSRGGGRGNRGTGGNHRDDPRRLHRCQGAKEYLTRDEIKRLASSDSEEVARYITKEEGGFLAAYSHPANCSHPLILKGLVKLLYLLVKSDEHTLAARMVARVFDEGSDDTGATFRTSLDTLIRKMPGEVKQHIQSENVQYIKYLIEIGRFALDSVPRSVIYTFPYRSLNDTTQMLAVMDPSRMRSLPVETEALAEEYSGILTANLLSTRSSGASGTSCRGSRAADIGPPPQPFTDISVLPTTDEVHPYAVKPYLRPNVTKGMYTDWEHYLDVQFRLMREDFLAPLRNGIRQYELKGGGKYLSDVRVYEGVSIGSIVCLYSGVGFLLRFDIARFKRVNWEHSKRLIYGSLLCLSSDNFQTIYFATVVKRDPKLLKDGLVTVQFEGDRFNEVFQIDPDQQFVMVESTAYFEAYRHILNGLQNALKNHITEQLPTFKRYLVDCRLQPPVPAPRYLRLSLDRKLRLREVIDIKAGNPDVVVTDDSSWPPCEHTGLDESQLRAFRAAITQELSVIQGPPGTGKTFIGLKVVEALITNRSKLSNFPILVLCYTNHALDQFLEGIIEIKTKVKNPPGSKELNIVRIGGRCKTKSLEQYMLKARIDEIRQQRVLPASLYKPSSRLRKEIHQYQESIEYAQRRVKVTENRDKIFKLPVLEEFMLHMHLFQLTSEKPTERGREIDVWLNLWYIFEEENGEVSKGTREQQQTPEIHEDVDSESDSEDEYIQVDAEAHILEGERMIEGEELEVRRHRNRAPQQESDLYASNEYERQQSDTQWNVIQISTNERQRRIKKGLSNKPMSRQEASRVTDIWRLNLGRRWSLYLHWVNELIRNQKQLIADVAGRYNETCKEHTENRQAIDAFVIEEADIIGMTTTGAAKYNHVLSNMHPKIVIIEEAAEVFESHVFTSLTPSVQQLIMIGDHKQLRPKANCYNLEKDYGFCVSLFEKLARNNFPVVTLQVQHRMRPEIASLICPSIYDKLLNHESVEIYGHVKGIGHDLFFIDHTHPEKSNEDRDRSHSNDHEADFIVALCKYLLKQGYQPSEVTVLTMYRGQLLELKKRMKKSEFNGVRVAAVDDFQGEENEIILLSLVRSNSDGKVGFLSIENRICVSLSRAKVGFFVIGNLSMLRDKDDTVWPQILADLSQKGCTGKALPLRCQVHSKSIVMAATAKDFLKCPEGGCQQKCDFRLVCGHSCPRLCHPTDREHKKMKCKQNCLKLLDCGHQCKHKCFQCKNECPPCTELVPKMMSECNHEVMVPCHEWDSVFYACTKPCDMIIQCGHKCQELCSNPCTMVCRVPVEKELPCGHLGYVPCFQDASTVECTEQCDAPLDCGHKCAGKCGSCQMGRLHVRCQSKCGRTLVCSHECKFPCTPTCPPCMEECTNYCVHSKCQRKCYEPCIPCREPCAWKCEHFQCSRQCGQLCDRPPCDEPCKKTLKCGHPCIGLCGEKCPTKCRICDKDEVCEILFGNEDEEDARFIQFEECKHIIEVTACDTWMKQADDESKPAKVQFKSCPKCKTQIRKSVRYGNSVKLTLKDYEKIKQKQQVMLSDDVIEKLHDTQQKVVQLSSSHLLKIDQKLKLIAELLQSSSQSVERSLPPHHVNNINAQLSYFSHIVNMMKHLSSLESTSNVHQSLSTFGIGIKDLQCSIANLIDFIMPDFLSDQQVSDIESEIYRLMCLIKLLDVWCKIGSGSVATDDRVNLRSIVVRMQHSGWKLPKLKEEDYNEITKFITTMTKKYQVSGPITKDERIAIVKAIGLSKGHWFKCPNGHYYCIGECGGAMVEAKCPECGATIGGRSHRLRDDNQLATEMDGAQHAAWSEFTNLANFDPNQLM